MHRTTKYIWAAAVTAMMVLTMTLDSKSPFLPLINGAIDVMQQQQMNQTNK